MRRAVWPLAIVVSALLLLAAPAQATFPGQNGKIAYSGGGPGGCGIFVVNPDGTGATQITQSPCAVDLSGLGVPIAAEDTSPNWSADGRKLVFVRRTIVTTASRRSLRDDIYSVNADGGGLTRVTTNGDAPAWSPDGQRIVFMSGNPGHRDLLVVRADGTQVTPIATEGEGNVAPDWSPDGATIAFSRLPTGGHFNSDIHLVNPDGSNDRPITSSAPESMFLNSDPSWSPDGRRFALTRTDVPFICCRHALDVWVMNADGSGLTNLTPDTFDRDDEAPVWSPDGTKLAFDTGGGGLRVMNPDGTDKTLVTITLGGRASWQPIPGPRRGDYKNAAKFCKAERDFLGDADFGQKYGTNGNGANAFGKCVSAS